MQHEIVLKNAFTTSPSWFDIDYIVVTSGDDNLEYVSYAQDDHRYSYTLRKYTTSSTHIGRQRARNSIWWLMAHNAERPTATIL